MDRDMTHQDRKSVVSLSMGLEIVLAHRPCPFSVDRRSEVDHCFASVGPCLNIIEVDTCIARIQTLSVNPAASFVIPEENKTSWWFPVGAVYFFVVVFLLPFFFDLEPSWLGRPPALRCLDKVPCLPRARQI